MNARALFATSALISVFVAPSPAAVRILVDHNSNEDAAPRFRFKSVPSPSRGDAAKAAKFTIVDGERDENGGDLDKLHDGRLPGDEDQPAANFFFAQGADGGRIVVDLGAAIEVKQVNTYSWHSNTRGPQVYKLYASDGASAEFKSGPKKDTDPQSCGWRQVAKVDTRPIQGQGGGQYGVDRKSVV